MYIRQIINGFRYSFWGLCDSWRTEAAFRIEVVMLIASIPLAFYVAHTGLDRVLLIGSVLVIIIAELLNTAIEVVVDLASPEKHALAKKAKDAGSAAVLVALANAGLIWAFILYSVYF